MNIENLKYFLEAYISRFGILILQFLLPISLMFAFLYLWKNQPWKTSRIQTREPNPKFIWHEIRYTILSFFLLSIVVTIDGLLLEQSFTKGYSSISEYGWIYFAFSVLILIVLYDIYFYTIHRILHHKKIYAFVHRTHHRSPTITPFGAFSINFWEAFFEFLFLPAMIFLIPLHSAALLIFISVYVIFNSYVHSGYEILPKFWVTTPFKYINTSVHHNLHHSKLKYNFGLFTNFLDRIFKTQIPNYEQEFIKIKEKSNQPALAK